MELYLARHGVTDKNKAKIFQGRGPGYLNADGENQSRLLGEYLLPIPLDAIHSSRQTRATETATIVQEVLREHGRMIGTHAFKELNERSLGKLEGQPKEGRSIEELTEDEKLQYDIEAYQDLQGRVLHHLNFCYGLYRNKNILLVSHHHTITAIQALLLGEARNNYLRQGADGKVKKPENTALSHFSVSRVGGTYQAAVHLYNSSVHLERGTSEKVTLKAMVARTT